MFWARLEENIVFEVINFEPDGNFHESMVWKSCSSDVEQGWIYDPDTDTFSEPLE